MKPHLPTKLFAIAFCCCLIFVPGRLSVQSAQQVTTAFAVFEKKVESKSATINQEVSLRIVRDVLVDGKLVFAAGSKVFGHITELATKGSDSPQSILALIIEKVVLENGREIRLQAIIAAVAESQNNSLANDPTYAMLHSNEPKMVGSGPSGAAGSGSLPASSKVDSTAAVATARIKGMDDGLLLTSDSSGTVGFPGLALSWRLTTPPPVTVFSSKNKNIKLDAGTQVLLRMSPPG